MAKYVLVTLDYPPETGGVARYLAELVKQSRGAIRVIVPERHPADGPGDVTNGVFFRPGWPAWRPLVSLLRRLKETVVVSHVFPVGTAAWIAKNLGGPEYAVVFHGLDLRLARGPWKRWLLRRICRRASVLVANSEATKDELRKRVPGAGNKLITLTPGVEDRQVPTRADARRALGLDDRTPVVLSVARLVPRKGIDIALRAMSRIQRRSDVEYVVIGDGPDAERLEAVAGECRARVRWVKTAEEDEKWLWFAASDVFLLPVRDEGADVEGFGIVFLEAALAGVPSVAGESGGAPEAVRHERTGLVVKPTSVDQVEEAVETLLRDADMRVRLGTAAKERVLNDFRWQDRWATLERKLES